VASAPPVEQSTPPATGATGGLEIATTPAAARITIDGRSQAKKSPVTLKDLPAGDVEVRIEKDGYLPQAKVVKIPAGGTAQASFALQVDPAAPATLEIKVVPFATYFIDDQQVAANVASTRQTVRPGTHTIRVVHPAFDPHEWKGVKVAPGKTVSLAFDFIAASQKPTGNGTVRVACDPWGEVVIDGNRTGKFTPCEITLPAGNHVVSVVKDGFALDGSPQTVALKNGPPVSVSFKLKKK